MAKYSDIDFFLQKNDITNDISFKQDIHAVAQSIKNILLTRKGEGFFDPNFGSSLLEKLSTKLDSVEISILKTVVKSEIQVQEPRGAVNSIEITPYLDSYDVKVSFSLVSSEQEGAVEITI